MRALKLVMSIRRRFLVAAVPMVLAGAAGCSTYSYFDIDIRLDSSKWGSSAAANLISTCHMFVSGATSGDFDVNGDKAVCPPDPPSTDVGVIKYSTFADSGNVTFTLKAYQGAGQTDACETGEGTVTLPLALGHTSSGTLMIAPTGKTCQ